MCAKNGKLYVIIMIYFLLLYYRTNRIQNLYCMMLQIYYMSFDLILISLPLAYANSNSTDSKDLGNIIALHKL